MISKIHKRNAIFVISLVVLFTAFLLLSCEESEDEEEDDRAVDDDDDDTYYSDDDDDDDNDDDDNNDDNDDDNDDNDDDDTVFMDCTEEECRIPGGEFAMGCEPGDVGCYYDENPRHDVQVAEFWMDKYEVTNDQYAQYLNSENPSNNCDGHQCVYSVHPGFSGLYLSSGTWQVDSTYENRPVVFVSWYGAKAYCESKSKRLPTEAEWEKAAKGPYMFIFPWGLKWFTNASNWATNGDPYEVGNNPTTVPVGYFDGSTHGSYQTADGASVYGPFDVSGNAWEWVSDWYLDTYYSSTPSGGWIDPTGPASGETKGIRGGGWQDPSSSVPRNSTRKHMAPDQMKIDIGFRCVRND